MRSRRYTRHVKTQALGQPAIGPDGERRVHQMTCGGGRVRMRRGLQNLVEGAVGKEFVRFVGE